MKKKLSNYNKSRGSDGLEKVSVLMEVKSDVQTRLARLFFIGDAKYWLPLSEIIVSDTSIPSQKSVEMPLWLARKNGLEDYVE